tara:strand:+ start:65 stop:274 length:210 start_codon:yes stop_codon:yes gene_type:complete
MTNWKTATNKVITENLLDNIALLTNGKWYRSSTLDYTGKQTTKYTIEFDTPKESDDTGSNVSGRDSSDT